MAAGEHRLSFEKPIYELEARLQKLGEIREQNPEIRNEIRVVRRELADLKKKIFSELKPSEIVEVARHPNRPRTIWPWSSKNSSNCTVTSSSATIGRSAPVSPSSTRSA
jgi:hypothetical protein